MFSILSIFIFIFIFYVRKMFRYIFYFLLNTFHKSYYSMNKFILLGSDY